MYKKAFYLWLNIAIFMFFIIVIDFILFEDLIIYWHKFFYVKEIFISLFAGTILISIFAIGYFFEKQGVISFQNRFIGYLKLYFSIFWRALMFVVPIIGLIAYIYHGSIGSRIATIFIEILAGFPAIYWYLRKISKNS
ncbi:hypothetical protein [Nautilia lithotrophica]